MTCHVGTLLAIIGYILYASSCHGTALRTAAIILAIAHGVEMGYHLARKLRPWLESNLSRRKEDHDG